MTGKKTIMSESLWLYYMQIFSITILLICDSVAYKKLTFFGIQFPASALIFTLNYTVTDVIANIYGYKVSKRLVWATLFCHIVFMIGIIAIECLQNQTDNDFLFNSLKTLFASCVGFFVSAQLNAFLITRLKWFPFIGGHFFPLRSLFSTSIAQFSVCLSSYPLLFIGTYPFTEIIQMIINAWQIKSILWFLLVLPAYLLNKLIKKIEQIEVNDNPPKGYELDTFISEYLSRK